MSLLERIINNPQRTLTEIKSLRKEAEENRKRRQRVEHNMNVLWDMIPDYLTSEVYAELIARYNDAAHHEPR